MDSPGQSINTEQELRELYAALDERDRHIQDLEYELENGNSAEIYAIQQENSNLSAELEAQRDELIKCRDTVADLQIQVEEHANAQRSQVDTLRTQLAQHSKASEDVKRLKKDGNQQLHRLELENQRLRATIIEIEENEDILVNEIDTLVKEKSAYQESSEALSSKCDSLYAELDEKDRVNADLRVETSKLQSDLETEKAAHATSESEWKKRDGDCRLEIAKLKEEIERERARHHSKEYESNKIELAKARKENQHLLLSLQQCIKDKNDAERDLDSAIQALNQSKANVKEEIAAVSRKERAVSAEIKRQLKKVEDREKSLVVRCADLEEQLQDVNNRLDKSEQRNSRYEENHGLTDAVRHQRKLEADLRRRDYDMKQLNHKLSLEIEHGRMLAKALELTRQHASSDFEIDDEELRAAVLRDDNILRSENEELTRQVEALEGTLIW
jgi:chromosome segregation ATPase